MKRRATATLATLGLLVLAVLVVPPLRAEADWLLATLHDTRDAYAAYAAAWPHGRHGAEALAREDNLVWRIAEGLGTIAAYEGYLQGHADGAYAPTASTRIDDLTWADALAERSAASLERYLLAYPAGRHLEQARATLEEVRWHDAYAANAVEPALAYVAAYRDGRFAAAAASRNDMPRNTRPDRETLTAPPQVSVASAAPARNSGAPWMSCSSCSRRVRRRCRGVPRRPGRARRA